VTSLDRRLAQLDWVIGARGGMLNTVL
jgi:hypothetical protein